MDVKIINQMDEAELHEALFRCCGSTKWVDMMKAYYPYKDWEYLDGLAEIIWFDECESEDWLEAFSHHPKIGDIKSLEKKFASTKKWAGNEQSGVNSASREVIEALASGNEAYEKKFGYIFIVCATGKSANEMLDLLNNRIGNGPKAELMQAGIEQYKITRLRLKKLITNK